MIAFNVIFTAETLRRREKLRNRRVGADTVRRRYEREKRETDSIETLVSLSFLGVSASRR
jgi:hypothetical protein